MPCIGCRPSSCGKAAAGPRDERIARDSALGLGQNAPRIAKPCKAMQSQGTKCAASCSRFLESSGEAYHRLDWLVNEAMY